VISSTLFPVIEAVCDQYVDAELTAMCSFAPAGRRTGDGLTSTPIGGCL